MGDACMTKESVPCCSFCGVSCDEIPFGVIISAATAKICNACVDLCRDIVWDWRDRQWEKLKDLAP